MTLVWIYKFSNFVKEMDCPYYKPRSHAGTVCRYNPKTCPNREVMIELFSGQLDGVICILGVEEPQREIEYLSNKKEMEIEL